LNTALTATVQCDSSASPDGEPTMTQIADVMTRGVRSMRPEDSVQFAAQAMDELNVGALPVCDGDRLVGMVTDRDITVRCVAQGLPGESTQLEQVLSGNVRFCREDQTVDEAVEMMQAAGIRRLPVVDSTQKLVGIVSLGDIAVKGSPDLASEALEGVSFPAEPDRSGFSAAGGPAAGGSASGEASRTPG
jgi:CBS domain-containing protein